MSADRMADCTQKLQDLIRSLIIQHVQFFLGPTDVQSVAICLIWCRVVSLAMSGLAFSVAPAYVVAKAGHF